MAVHYVTAALRKLHTPIFFFDSAQCHRSSIVMYHWELLVIFIRFYIIFYYQQDSLAVISSSPSNHRPALEGYKKVLSHKRHLAGINCSLPFWNCSRTICRFCTAAAYCCSCSCVDASCIMALSRCPATVCNCCFKLSSCCEASKLSKTQVRVSRALCGLQLYRSHQCLLTITVMIIHTELLVAKIKSCIPALWQGRQYFFNIARAIFFKYCPDFMWPII